MTKESCKFVGDCGSCNLNLSYQEQICFKENFIKEEFGEFYGGEFEFFASSPLHYRTRAEFGIWHEIRQTSSEISYTMHGVNSKKIFIDSCPKVSLDIAEIMPKILAKISVDNELKQRLFGIEFLSCSSGILATLLYHKRLDDGFLRNIKQLANELNISVMARAKGQKLLSGELNLLDELKILGRVYKFYLSENAFIQPNKSVNEKMISWAKECVEQGEDLLEMYCGHGNFTIPLSQKFRQVLATEISKKSIQNALKNCDLNAVNNIKFARLSSEELIEAFDKVREFRRLEGINLDEFNFSHILVDPPRAGLDESVINFIKNYENIIYISCSPKSLKQNLKEICKTHRVAKFAIFDQFANTTHIECGVLLRRKDGH